MDWCGAGHMRLPFSAPFAGAAAHKGPYSHPAPRWTSLLFSLSAGLSVCVASWQHRPGTGLPGSDSLWTG